MIIGIILGGLLFLFYRLLFYDKDFECVEKNMFTYARRAHNVEIWTYTWDGSEDGLVIEIPDTLDGRPVTALGGVGGSSLAPFFIDSEAAYPEYKSKMDAYRNGEIELENEEEEVGGIIDDFADMIDTWTGEIKYIDFTLKIGPNVKSIIASGKDAECVIIDGVDIILVNRVYVECDPQNKKFYSENGILYKRNGEKVESLWYQE